MTFPESSIIPEGVRVQTDQKHINDVRRDAFNNPALIGGRLTLDANNSVADVTAGGTLYYRPYLHDRVPVWDGSRWVSTPFTTRSLSLAGHDAAKNYDVFLDAGLTLSSSVWTNDKTRAVTLTRQEGLLVDAADPTRLFLGTFRTRSDVATQCDDNTGFRTLSNYYNRVPRPFLGYVTADSSGTITGATGTELHNNFRAHWVACSSDTFLHLDWRAGYYESDHWTSRFYFMRGTTDAVTGLYSIVGEVDTTAEHGGPVSVHWSGLPGLGWEYFKVMGASGGSVKWRAIPATGTTGWIEN